MSSDPLPPIVSDQGALIDLIGQLEPEPYVAVDTEFLRDTTYWPQLCLIQIASPSGIEAIIDPLSGIDLAPFHAFLARSAPVKVFHAGRQDLEIFFHGGGVIPAPLFDTQIAAMVCGFGDSVGYETLARTLAQATIDKGARFTDWRRRPLSDKQLAYAIADVTHLLTVYRALSAQIDAAGRRHWIEEEMTVLADPATYDLTPENAYQRLKLRDVRPRTLAVAVEVAAWREREAQSRDVPRQRILKDDVLQEVLNARPKDRQAMESLRAIPKGWAASELGQGLLEAVVRGLDRPLEGLPAVETSRRVEIPPARIDLLKTLLRSRAENHGVAAKLIATTADLEGLIAGDAGPLGHGWRHEIFGADALRLLKGEVGLALQGDAVEIVPVVR